MKSKATILLLLTTSCTPFEREVAEEVIHEASVAEHAIEQDLNDDCPGCRSMQQDANPQTAVKNQRQYPKRNRNRIDWNHGV